MCACCAAVSAVLLQISSFISPQGKTSVDMVLVVTSCGSLISFRLHDKTMALEESTIAPHTEVPSKSQLCQDLRLTETEESLFELLLNAVEDKGLDTTLRVAGGWVRDKLLHLGNTASHDIDISVEGMLGRHFAEHLNDWLKTRGLPPRKIGVMAANPEESNKPERATLRLKGVQVDFVNLRTDFCTEDSGMPTIYQTGKPGGASVACVVDAYRRDLTINALFYNLHEKKVEDFTGRGIEDLRAGVLRTPLDPVKVLLGTPLRVLRTIRFASRFNFRISPELETACRDARVHQALADKVPRERIGAELDKMMSCSDPVQCPWQLLTSFGLAPVHFLQPEVLDRYVRSSKSPNEMCVDGILRDGLMTVKNLHSVMKQSVEQWGPDEKKLMSYAAFHAPLAGLQYKVDNGRLSPLISHLLGSRLKLPRQVAQGVALILSTALEFQRLVGEWAEGAVPPPPKTDGAARSSAADHSVHDADKASDASQRSRYGRVDLGLIVRRAGKLWKASLAVAMAGAIGRTPLESAQHLMSGYRAVEEAIDEFGLIGVWKRDPPLGGKAVKDVLPCLPTGPELNEIMKHVMDAQVVWMLAHPDGTADECREFIKREVGRFCGVSRAESLTSLRYYRYVRDESPDGPSLYGEISQSGEFSSEEMFGPVVVSFDIDGTLANIEKRLALKPVPRSDADWDVILSGDNYYLDEPIPEARAFLQQLVQLTRHHPADGDPPSSPITIVYLSGRRAGTEVQTSQWLAAHGFPHGVIFHRPKGVKGGLFKERVLRCLHQPPRRHVMAHVGDRPMEDALAAVKTGVRPVLIAPNEWTGKAHSASQECDRPAGWVATSTLESIVDDESREGKQPSMSSREVAEGHSLLRI
ncbi:unnamed protein product [Vitrella brassicaformis CCMP3155]|uniref:Poly A polymerase head domain-containing protein n=1 Tax=Vitrella brassicaformis (strain CCMP3155) TaxID=1169540 RepID=A0A0G4EIC4_VITBC|nr:unnamed protein product [Vitrella brassicaformis CCMP3155]|eukprot:CEL95753.1 unnamed protein product [Vitrella brassicaformis CCMP3155]